MRSYKKDIQHLLRRARRAGYKVERRRSGHYRITVPGTGERFSLPATPRTARTLRFVESKLRRLLPEP